MASEWPALPYDEWRATRDTLHMYTQVIGKLRLALSPFEPEWAHVALYVTARGLTTSPMPVGLRSFDAELDLIDHVLVLRSNGGGIERRPLGGAVADFYDDVMRALQRLDLNVAISVLPSEVANPIPFPDDRTHATYDAGHASRFHRVLSLIDLVAKEHHAGFRGRTTPVQFFWGAFDLALFRFSGKPAEPPPGARTIERFGGDAEQICAGWWPGNDLFQYPAFYAYAYPPTPRLDEVPVQPQAAAWNTSAGEFFLPYDAIRSEADPRQAILDFFRSTYQGAARLRGWDPELTQINTPHSYGSIA
ncbi:MAG: DUF5996 family protein [Candidatus Dormibacteria bacterium]